MPGTPFCRRAKQAYIAVMGLLALAVLVLSIVQTWILATGDIASASRAIPADERGLPPADRRGAFIVLQDGHMNPVYQGNLVELLATTQPGVVAPETGGHFKPGEIRQVIIQSAVISEETSEYQIYRIGVDENQQFTRARQPGGKLLTIETASGSWEPGAYLVDIPSEGMFGGRTYFQFYVDAEQ